MFYGRWDDDTRHPEQVSAESLLAILDRIGDGVTEIGCHPGYADGLASRYSIEREDELRALTDERVRARIAERGIELIGFDAL
jgi:predicted glycoside hydrolase/deacetylase ChbG (UPF0249 family)